MRRLAPLLLPLLPLLLLPAAPALAAPEAGTTKACLPVAMIRDTSVIDGQTIDFTLRDGSRWRNRLPGGQCAQLGFERAFSYQTSIAQLCRMDLITVLQTNGGLMAGTRCGLGDFVALPPPAPKAKR